ncbi:MAG: DJ-1/PfpI family protein [Deltaproteobacteria bacterium]|nr:DJ-1/PfpI family protein [Deltaproteobacteria bacterium]
MIRFICRLTVLAALVSSFGLGDTLFDAEKLSDVLQAKAYAQEGRRAATPKRVAAKAHQKRVLMVIAPKNFRDEELFKTREVIEAAGHSVILASLSTEESVGMLGGKAKPDITIAEAKAAEYDAVVFVGGSGAAVLLDHAQTLALARDADRAGKLVAAICIAPGILANSDLLRGKRATSWSGEHDHLKEKGAKVTNKRVEQDGRIITGNGPSAAKAFGEAIVRYLAKSQH